MPESHVHVVPGFNETLGAAFLPFIFINYAALSASAFLYPSQAS